MKNRITTAVFKCVLFFTFVFFQLSCSKDDPAPVAVTACFEDAYNGTYKGNDQSSIDEVTVKFTKTSCTTAKLESAILGNKNIKEINASGPGAFSGKLDNGTPVAIGLTGVTLAISCEGYGFSGTKQ